MSATAYANATTDTAPSLQTVLEEIAQTVHDNADSLSLSLDLLKRIIELLLPKATDEGPTLAELLAALLTTMRELLIVGKANAEGIDEIVQRLDAAGFKKPVVQPGANGHPRA